MPNSEYWKGWGEGRDALTNAILDYLWESDEEDVDVLVDTLVALIEREVGSWDEEDEEDYGATDSD